MVDPRSLEAGQSALLLMAALGICSCYKNVASHRTSSNSVHIASLVRRTKAFEEVESP